MTDIDRLAAQLDASAERSGPAVDAETAAVVAQLSQESTWSGPPPELRNTVLTSILGEAHALGETQPPVRPAPPVTLVARPARWRQLTWAIPLTAAAAVLISVGTLFADRALHPAAGPGVTYVAAGSPAAPGAAADVTIASSAAGFSVVISPHHLAPAPAGSYYAAWLKKDKTAEIRVPLGSFHERGSGDPIKLWSGVDPRDFPLFTVTLQKETEPATARGELVLSAPLTRPK